jgi:hypothetical protein
MTCSTPSDLGAPPGVELIVPEDPEAQDTLVRVQAEAFGEPPPAPDAGGEKQALLSRGGQAVLALAGGRPAAGGIVVAPVEGVAELAGLGVLEASGAGGSARRSRRSSRGGRSRAGRGSSGSRRATRAPSGSTPGRASP